jgi:hypothetical protein
MAQMPARAPATGKQQAYLAFSLRAAQVGHASRAWDHDGGTRRLLGRPAGVGARLTAAHRLAVSPLVLVRQNRDQSLLSVQGPSRCRQHTRKRF